MAIDLLSLVVASAVMNLAFLGLSAFTWVRAKGSVQGPGYWFAGFTCLTLGMALKTIYTLAQPSLSARLFAISLANTLLGALSSYCLVFKSPPALKSHARMSLVFFGSFTLLYAIRIGTAIPQDHGENWFPQGDGFES